MENLLQDITFRVFQSIFPGAKKIKGVSRSSRVFGRLASSYLSSQLESYFLSYKRRKDKDLLVSIDVLLERKKTFRVSLKIDISSAKV